MGVSGVGKTTLGISLASKLDLPFYEGDEFHTENNIRKMKNGQPLNDDDRLGWLEAISEKIKDSANKDGGVFTCSALKEKYREYIREKSGTTITWVYLYESFEVIYNRMKSRKNHFFKPEMLKSQFDILEPPEYAIHVKVEKTPEKTLELIMKKLNSPEIGIIGLGVMGKSLAINMAGKNIRVSVYNREIKGTEENIAGSFAKKHKDQYEFPWFDNLANFVNSLPRPRNILLMVNAGKAVDCVIDDLIPYLDSDDLIIDAGNSHYTDTSRRTDYLRNKNILYLGTGVSGGEEGARKGPSIMPGGSEAAYKRVSSILETIAAKDNKGKPCCSFIGPGGSGHFVKMLHNGIEYGEMQLIAEFYTFMRFHLKIPISQIADLFLEWNKELRSYLVEISAAILQKKEGSGLLLDKILDVAGQKGTGGWSTQAALELGVPLDTITAAVMARNISGQKENRVKAAEKYGWETARNVSSDSIKKQNLFKTFKAVHIINHAIGFDLLQHASAEYNWSLNLSEIARIWTNGCIIRSGFMEDLVAIFKEKSPEHLLLQPGIVSELKTNRPEISNVVSEALKSGCPMPVSSAALNYLYSFTTAKSSASMIQAQRDFFGAHTYERNDRPKGEFFHTQWKNTD